METKEAGRVLFLRWDGPLDGSGPTPEQVAVSAAGCGARYVLLDATRAAYADSAGLRWLLQLRSELAAAGKQLRIAAKRGGKVWRNLALLDAGLEVFGSLGGAWRGPWAAADRGRRRSGGALSSDA